jgi:hypothetical protein
MPEESDGETDHEEASSRQGTSEQTGSGTPPSPSPLIVTYPAAEADSTVPNPAPHAKAVAATRGLQISVGGKNMHRASGLPTSPRPIRYPGSPGMGGNA